MKYVSIFLFLFLLFSFVIEFSLNINLSPAKGISLKNLSIYLIIIWLVVGNLLRRLPLLQRNKINIPIIAFGSYLFFSIMIRLVFDPGSSFINKLVIFKAYMDPFILAIIIYNFVHDTKTAKFMISSLIILVLVFNLFTIMDYLELIDIKRIGTHARLGRTGGAFSNANQYAAYITLFMPISVNAFLYNKNYLYKILMILVTLLGFYCVLLTGSRGGLLAIIVGLAALVLLNARKISLPLVMKTVGGGVVTILLFSLAFYYLPDITKAGMEENIVERAKTQDLDQYSSGRLHCWRKGMELFSRNPVFGTGWGTFPRLVGLNSHNDYLLILTTLGLPGLCLFLWIFYSIYQSSMEFKGYSEINRWYYSGYLAGLLSFAIAMFFVNIFTPYYFFFIFSALILKLGYLEGLDLRD